MHKAKLFLSSKIVQRKMLNMFRGHLLKFEVRITGTKTIFFQQSIHCCCCKRWNDSQGPDDSPLVLLHKHPFMLRGSDFSVICSDDFMLSQKSFMISKRLHFRDTGRISLGDKKCLNSDLKHVGPLNKKESVMQGKNSGLNLFSRTVKAPNT